MKIKIKLHAVILIALLLVTILLSFLYYLIDIKITSKVNDYLKTQTTRDISTFKELDKYLVDGNFTLFSEKYLTSIVNGLSDSVLSIVMKEKHSSESELKNRITCDSSIKK